MKFSAKTIFLLFVCSMFFQSVNAQTLDEWKLRMSVTEGVTTGDGLGRKVAIAGDKVVIATGRSDYVQVVDASTDTVIGPILDPVENDGGVSGAPITEEESFGYSVSVAITVSGIKILVGDTENDRDSMGNIIADLALAAPGQAHLYNLSLANEISLARNFDNPSETNVVEVGLGPGITFPVGSQFGHDVAIADNWAVVGAPFDNASIYGADLIGQKAGAGKAFLFDTDSSGQPYELLDPTPGFDNKFGAYVAASNGIVTVSDHCDGMGFVHVYNTDDVNSAQLDAAYTIPRVDDNADAQQFGWDTDMYGDLLLVGHTGGASLYRLGMDSATHLFTIDSPDSMTMQSPDNFGRVVAIDGDRIAIGQQGIETIDGEVLLEGLVKIYQYDVVAETFELEQTITDPTVSSVGSEQFPSGLDIEGDYLAIGSNRQLTPTGGLYQGEALIYEFGIRLGDVNRDNNVNLLDVSGFIDAISSGLYQVEADTNCDGAVNLLDTADFIDLLGG